MQLVRDIMTPPGGASNSVTTRASMHYFFRLSFDSSVTLQRADLLPGELHANLDQSRSLLQRL